MAVPAPEPVAAAAEAVAGAMAEVASPPALVCPACGEATALGDVFCEACGADLPPTVAPAEAAAAPGADDEGLSVPTGSAFAAPCPSCGAAGVEIVEGYCGVCGMKQPALRDHLEEVGAGVAAVTDRGKRHHRNEDAFAMAVAAVGAGDGAGRVVAVVCDGVSTTVNPDAASQAAADAAGAVLVAGGALPAAYAAARDAVLAVPWVPDPRLGAPSCTFLAAVVDGDHVELATMGDCRSVWLPVAGEAQTLTEDDSWAAEAIAAGAKTVDEAYADNRAHVITRWLGADADPAWEPRLSSFTAPGRGRLLLCSDGLWNYAETAAEVAQVAEVAVAAGTGDAGDAPDLLATARGLVDFANRAGGSDNITVVLVDLPRPRPDSSKGPAA
ncbi:MAG: family protein phosphatase [Actinomycetota bacterium]|jgi:serine/threonine protein phosphatase PrpC|nr:family protein phosphatase [Actinomycetota bacterium]